MKLRTLEFSKSLKSILPFSLFHEFTLRVESSGGIRGGIRGGCDSVESRHGERASSHSNPRLTVCFSAPQHSLLALNPCRRSHLHPLLMISVPLYSLVCITRHCKRRETPGLPAANFVPKLTSGLLSCNSLGLHHLFIVSYIYSHHLYLFSPIAFSIGSLQILSVCIPYAVNKLSNYHLSAGFSGSTGFFSAFSATFGRIDLEGLKLES